MDGDLSQMIQKIMQNPEFSNMVNELRGEMSGDKQSGTSEQQSGVSGQRSNDDITAEMMSKLPDVMAMVSPLLGKSDSSKASDKPHDNSENHLEKGTKGHDKYDKARAEKLLYAIKPYLSQTRCEMIDKCVSVMQLGDIMGALGGVEGLLGGKKGHGGEGGN